MLCYWWATLYIRNKVFIRSAKCISYTLLSKQSVQQRVFRQQQMFRTFCFCLVHLPLKTLMGRQNTSQRNLRILLYHQLRISFIVLWICLEFCFSSGILISWQNCTSTYTSTSIPKSKFFLEPCFYERILLDLYDTKSLGYDDRCLNLTRLQEVLKNWSYHKQIQGRIIKSLLLIRNKTIDRTEYEGSTSTLWLQNPSVNNQWKTTSTISYFSIKWTNNNKS